MELQSVVGDRRNFIFVGESGSGKSEVALNFALWLKLLGDERDVHFFDLDMTKPLFRSRDVEAVQEAAGVHMHYQQQFMDAPTLVGGVRPLLKNQDAYTLLDVGGDYIGARSIGGFHAELRREDTAVFYILNAFRPWTDTIEHIDQTMGKILGVSHIPLERIQMVNNTNQGPATTADDFLTGTRRLEATLTPYAELAFSTVCRDLHTEVQGKLEAPVFPIELLLSDPWEQ